MSTTLALLEDVPLPRTVFAIGATCPRCGAELDREACSVPHDAGRRSTAVLKCNERACRHRWLLVVSLLDWQDAGALTGEVQIREQPL